MLRDRTNAAARLTFSMAMWMAIVVTPDQILAGDIHGLNTREHQPMKIAVMEGHYETRRGAPLILFGWPDHDAATVRYKIEVLKPPSPAEANPRLEIAIRCVQRERWRSACSGPANGILE